MPLSILVSPIGSPLLRMLLSSSGGSDAYFHLSHHSRHSLALLALFLQHHAAHTPASPPRPVYLRNEKERSRAQRQALHAIQPLPPAEQEKAQDCEIQRRRQREAQDCGQQQHYRRHHTVRPRRHEQSRRDVRLRGRRGRERR